MNELVKMWKVKEAQDVTKKFCQCRKRCHHLGFDQVTGATFLWGTVALATE